MKGGCDEKTKLLFRNKLIGGEPLDVLVSMGGAFLRLC